jgi:hypothetical protein
VSYRDRCWRRRELTPYPSSVPADYDGHCYVPARSWTPEDAAHFDCIEVPAGHRIGWAMRKYRRRRIRLARPDEP